MSPFKIEYLSVDFRWHTCRLVYLVTSETNWQAKEAQYLPSLLFAYLIIHFPSSHLPFFILSISISFIITHFAPSPLYYFVLCFTLDMSRLQYIYGPMSLVSSPWIFANWKLRRKTLTLLINFTLLLEVPIFFFTALIRKLFPCIWKPVNPCFKQKCRCSAHLLVYFI